MSDNPDVGQIKADREAEPQRLSEEALAGLLEAHRTWVLSGQKEGRRADLEGANLRQANLFDAQLQEASLARAQLQGAFLAGADLRNADLREATLSDVTGLCATQLAGADLTNAKLPADVARFEELQHVEETSKNARKIFFGLLLGCAYSWLTVATTTDAELLPSSATTPLPIIQTEIPIAGFYWAAPIILFAAYIYLHLYLQRLWVGLASLPARFPDGLPLDRKAYPWLLNGLVRQHFPRLGGSRTVLSRLENWISIFLAWWLVPLTLVVFWGRYLPRHDWSGTTFQLVLLAVSVLAATMLRRNTIRTLEGGFWRLAPTTQLATALAALVASALISVGAIEGEPRHEIDLHIGSPVIAGPQTWVPYTFERFGYRTFGDLREADVSTKPQNWRGDSKDLPLVKGATLKRRNLRYANAEHAFLARADFRFANLERAVLTGANLEGADFRFAHLQAVHLARANLQRANFLAANLRGPISWGRTCWEPTSKKPPSKGQKILPRSSSIGPAETRKQSYQRA